MTRPLRSARITRHHRYYETVRPCASPPVLNPLRLTTSWSAPSRPRHHTRVAFETTGSRVPCRSPDQTRATYMPDTTWAVSRSPPGSSQKHDQLPVLMPSKTFDTSAVVRSRSPSWSIPDAVIATPFPRRSPPRLLTGAARGGLKPPPAERLRRAYLHLLHSYAQSAEHRSTSASPSCARGTRSAVFFSPRNGGR
jgi:hypothetical protein